MAAVAEVRADPTRREELVGLLRESSPLYVDRSASATARLRGWVLAAFEDVGLPPSALPFALEELESGIEPHLVAAAAKALRGGEWDPNVGRYLLAAFNNMRSRDDTVSFDSIRPSWPAARSTTALLEVLATVRWLGPADAATAGAWREKQHLYAGDLSRGVRESLAETVAALEASPVAAPRGGSSRFLDEGSRGPARTGAVLNVDIEDQDGTSSSFADFFASVPTVVAFFYTRCTNPYKCSLTITQLAQLQRLLPVKGLEGAVRLAALSYDPGYDTPGRMRRYGESRGLRFDEFVRMGRATRGHDRLLEHFDASVGYVGSIVNRHSVEAFLVGTDGSVAHTWSRLRWSPENVAARVAPLVSAGARE